MRSLLNEQIGEMRQEAAERDTVMANLTIRLARTTDLLAQMTLLILVVTVLSVLLFLFK